METLCNYLYKINYYYLLLYQCISAKRVRIKKYQLHQTQQHDFKQINKKKTNYETIPNKINS